MNYNVFEERKAKIVADYEAYVTRKNEMLFSVNGVYNKYKNQSE